MRDGWNEVQLGELIVQRKDFTSVEPDAEYVILGVQRSGWGFVEREPIKGSAQKFSKLMRVEKEDLVYRTITAFEAPSAVVTQRESGRFVTPQTFPVFRIDADRLLPTFMSLLTTSPHFHEQMASRCTGSVLRRKTLSVGAFKSIPVFLPPLAEQRRIVDLVGALDDAIEAVETTRAALAELTTARLASLFDTSDGPVVGLEDISSFASGAAFKPSAQGDPDGTIPFIKVSDMNLPGNETEILRANNYVTVDGLKTLKAKAWPAGTTVFPKVGAALLTEKRRILATDTAFDNNVMGLVPGPGVDPWFLFGFMRTVKLGDFAQVGALPSVNQKHLRALRVPKLDTGQQQHVADEVRALDDSRVAQAAAVASLRELRTNLLSVLLTGEHEVPTSYDELIDEEAVV